MPNNWYLLHRISRKVKEFGNVFSMSMLIPPVLSSKELETLVGHKFKAGKVTKLDEMIDPTWKWLCECLPTWLAPNSVTFIGFVPLLLSYLLIWKFSPQFSESVPSLVTYFTALSMVFYVVMDALDGKQARRTGTASPIGQLFDHGVDAFATIIFHTATSVALLPGPTRYAIGSLTILQITMFVGQWGEQHTGVLQTTCGPIGILEFQIITVLFVLSAAIAGPENVLAISNAPLFSVPWSQNPVTNGIFAVALFIISLAVISVLLAFHCLRYVIANAGKTQFIYAAKQLVPPVLTHVVAVFVWSDEVHAKNPRMLSLFTGLQLFFYTLQIIVSTMSSKRFCPNQFETLVPYTALAIVSRFFYGPLFDYVMDVASVLLALWVSFWIYRVLQESTERLGIRLFKISA